MAASNRQRLRPEEHANAENGGPDGADNQAGQGEIANRFLRAMPLCPRVLGRRQAREKPEGAGQGLKFGAEGHGVQSVIELGRSKRFAKKRSLSLRQADQPQR